MVNCIRLSEGTGAVLGLWDLRLSASPTTGYLMTDPEGGCTANCLFCSQSRSGDSSRGKLSRISWPRENFERFQEALIRDDGGLSRVCVQGLHYQGLVEDLLEIVGGIRDVSDISISVSSPPLGGDDLRRLADAGVERFSIPLDASTPWIFDLVKGYLVEGPYRWDIHIDALERARDIFDGRVTTHLIVGLGEEDLDVVRRVQFLHERGITVALFAFTPVQGSPLASYPRPSIRRYRRIQLARYLIVEDMSELKEMEFEDGCLRDFGVPQEEMEVVVNSGEPFKTSGCPACNRPFYNESPSGPLYNFPDIPSEEDLREIREDCFAP